MKTYCKRKDISSVEFITQAILNYMDDKKRNQQLIHFFSSWSRKPYREVKYLLTCACNNSYISYLIKTGTSEEEARAIAKEGREFYSTVTDEIALAMSVNIKARTVREHILLRKGYEEVIRYLDITDVGSRKRRDLGLECFVFRLYEAVANSAADPLFEAKVGEFQVAAVKGKGQRYGKKVINKWLSRDPAGTKFCIKADVSKCYPSMSHDVLKSMLHRDLHKSDQLLYLFDTIIDLYEEFPNPKSEDVKLGILIGSPVSKDLCNYYMSSLYHYACEKVCKIKTRRGKELRTRLLSHIMIYMDDIIIFGANKKDIQTAMKLLVKYAREILLLTIKPNWRKFRMMYKDKDGKAHGCLLDFMGFRFNCGKITEKNYFGRVVKHREIWISIRRWIFLRAWRKYRRIARMLRHRERVSFFYAKSVASYWGLFKHTNAAMFRKEHKIDQLMSITRRIVSDYAKGKQYDTEKYYKMWRCKCA